jgi:membrane protease YdiL (CAAX protease family)
VADQSRADSSDRAAAPRGTVVFFVAAFAITWLLQLPAVLAQRGVVAGPVERYMPLAGLGTFGPLIAAVLASRREAGGAGVRALFRALGPRGVGAGWYLVALGLPAATYTVGAAAVSLLGGVDVGPWLYPPSNGQRIAGMLMVPLVEEVGWRGFALPRLQARRGALGASLIIGVLWAVWHGPMLLLAGISAPSTFALMLPFFVCGSVVFTWIYDRTRGGLLFAVLAHMGAHLNNSHAPLPGDVTPLRIHTVVYAVLAVALVLADRRVFGAPRPQGDG